LIRALGAIARATIADTGGCVLWPV
jgi:hypothetical protein